MYFCHRLLPRAASIVFPELYSLFFFQAKNAKATVTVSTAITGQLINHPAVTASDLAGPRKRRYAVLCMQSANFVLNASFAKGRIVPKSIPFVINMLTHPLLLTHRRSPT